MYAVIPWSNRVGDGHWSRQSWWRMNGFEVGISKLQWGHLVFVETSFKQNTVFLAREVLKTFLETFGGVLEN
jgi:hypothetical protein